MAFIPNGPKVGDRVRIMHDVRVPAGTYTKGHEFTITGYSFRGPDMVDDDGRPLYEAFNVTIEKI